jgi:glycerol uptake facilitator-like aquaporin
MQIASAMMKSVTAECLGTLLLLATVVGSGIMGESLSGGNTAIALLANALAAGAMLFVLINIFGPISGAHFNPVVTLAMAATGRLEKARLVPFIATQCVGVVLAAVVSNSLFSDKP